MGYHEVIINRIKDSEKWPSANRPDFLDELNDVADNSFSKNSIEGYLAALLIYHQLTEELLKILIDCSVFYIQLRVFPQEYQVKNLNKKMFGQVIQELKHGVVDDKIRKLIDLAHELNALRITMIHKLSLESSVNEIKEQCKLAKDMYDNIFELYEEIYDNYRVSFKDYKKNSEDLEELIESRA